MLTYDVVTDLSELEQYKTFWSEILEEESNNNPFIEFEFIFYWWKFFAKGQKIEIYMIKEDDIPIAFFPFVREKKGKVQIFSFMCEKSANYMDMIARKEDKKMAIHFLFTSLEKVYTNVVFTLQGLLESSETTSFIEDYFVEKQRFYRIFRTVSPYINFKEVEFDQYIHKRRKLHGIDRREKRLKKLGNVSFRRANLFEFENMYQLFQQRWLKKVDTSHFTTMENQRLIESIVKSNSHALSIEVDALTFEDKWIGFRYGICCRNRYVSYALGHAPSFDIFGPGRLLDREKIINVYEEGYQIYDFSIGYENYKFDWYTNNDFTRKYISSTNDFPSKIMATLFSKKEDIITFLKKYQWIVHMKRNITGTIRYALRNRQLSELKGLINRVFAIKLVSIYERDEVLPGKYLYDSIPIQKCLHNNEKVISAYYKGYSVYKKHAKPKSNIAFFLHPKMLRVDSFNYLEQLPKSSCFITEIEFNQLHEITSYLNHQQYTNIFTINNFLNMKKHFALKRHHFKRTKLLFYLKLLKWEWKI